MRPETLLTIFVSGPNAKLIEYEKKHRGIYQLDRVKVNHEDFKARERYALAEEVTEAKTEGEQLPKETEQETSNRLWKKCNWGVHPDSLTATGFALRQHTKTSKFTIDIWDVVYSISGQYPELHFDVTYSNMHMSDTMYDVFAEGNYILHSNISCIRRD